MDRGARGISTSLIRTDTNSALLPVLYNDAGIAATAAGVCVWPGAQPARRIQRAVQHGPLPALPHDRRTALPRRAQVPVRQAPRRIPAVTWAAVAPAQWSECRA